MRFELAMVTELCCYVGLRFVRRSADEVAVHLGEGLTLLFQNVSTEYIGERSTPTTNENDNLIGFEGTPWHTHDGLTCSDRHGFYIELSYLDLVSGLADGTLLVCERWSQGELADRWIVHRDFVDEFRYLQNGEEIRIRSVARKRDASSPRSDGT
jgi:hypothetical protein